MSAKPASTELGSVALNATKTKTVTVKLDPGYRAGPIGGACVNIPVNFPGTGGV